MTARPFRRAVLRRLSSGGLLAVGCALALGLAGAGVAAAAGRATGGTSKATAAVLPVAGDRFASPGTSITFEGASAAQLFGLKVTGSRSGVHRGRLSALIGAAVRGEVFTPYLPFAPGESVSVATPDLVVPGDVGDVYSFAVSRPASPAQARRALALASEPLVAPAAASSRAASSPSRRASAPAARSSAAAGQYTPPPCPVLYYRSEPALHAQRACMNLGVVSSGTEAGNYLFLTPGGQYGDGEGIYEPNGDLVWWQPSGTAADHDLTVVTYDGQQYLAVWLGARSSDYGYGYVALYNEHYQLAGVVTAAGAFSGDKIDLHEFRITPQGDALVGIFDPVRETVDGRTVTVLQYVVQELSLTTGSNGMIETGSELFEWDSLSGAPVSQSHLPEPAAGGAWDYFHGNAISQDPTDGNIVVSSRNTWGIYKIDANPQDASFDKVLWEVGTKDSNSLEPEAWCYQHDVTALGDNHYSLYDDGGSGPGCEGPSQHPARGLFFTVDPSTSPATVVLDESYTHNPAIYTDYTGSTERLADGDVVIDWANVPEITEYDASGTQVKMDLSLSNWSYRGFSFPWDGQPLTPPSAAAQVQQGTTRVWMSWNGSTEVSQWQVLAGQNASQLTEVGALVPKGGFETSASVPGSYRVVEVQALNSSGTVLSTSEPADAMGYVAATAKGNVYNLGNAAWYGSAWSRSSAPVVAVASTPDHLGYWLVNSKGNVYNYGDASWHGSAWGRSSAAVVGIAATPDGHGYWLVNSKGNVYNYGDASWHGSAWGRSSAAVVGIAATPDGHGYWLATSAGNVYNFGDAATYGSMAGEALPSRVVSIAASPSGLGYWLGTASGNVYNYGDAGWYGSVAGTSPTAPVVGLANA